MTRNELISDLKTLPSRIAYAEDRYASAAADLELAEARLLLSGEIDGKNEATRKAQVTERLFSHEREVSRLRTDLHQLQNDLAAKKSIARLLGGPDL